ncbi:LysR family transcriptional regulator [Paraburkholderia sp. J67]|uniref:LysR family transcriptional regulator n=1 Tax=Paraburkholderia sp. J67 TaxID=2805435 RepID=UPI002ABE350B|nr:LysR family transcriptional regulator [Paraburkholderia sp. J67]
MDKLQAMQIFVRVADVGSFTKASDTLQLARSAVTRAVQELEEHLRIRLMNRTTRRLHLTEEGRQYYDSAKFILGAVEESEMQYREAVSNPKGTLKIDVQTSIARCLIGPRLHEFHALYPDIELNFGAADRIVDLIEEGVDCAIRVGDLSDSTLVARQVGVFRRITVASPTYLARAGQPGNLEDLSDHHVIHYTDGKGARPPMFEFATPKGIVNVRMKRSVQVNDTETYIALAKAGMGMIQAAQFSVASALESGELVEILPSFPVPKKPISIVYAHREKLAPKLRVFIDWVATLIEHSALGVTRARPAINPANAERISALRPG